MTTPNKDRAACRAAFDNDWRPYNSMYKDGESDVYEVYEAGYEAACADRDSVIAELVGCLQMLNDKVWGGDKMDGTEYKIVAELLEKPKAQGE